MANECLKKIDELTDLLDEAYDLLLDTTGHYLDMKDEQYPRHKEEINRCNDVMRRLSEKLGR